MARHGDNLVAHQATLESRGWRLWNRTATDLISATIDVPDEQPATVLGNGSASILGAAHRGLVVFDTTTLLPRFWNGSAWKPFNELTVDAGVYEGLPLAPGMILEGEVSGKAVAIPKSSVSLSEWGAPTTILNLNGNRIANVATPSNASDAATKDYVDSVATGLQVKVEAVLGSTQALPSCVYDGVAGTLTASVNSTLTAALIDSSSAISLTAGAEGTGTRVLIKDQSSQIQNGIYRVSNLGSGASKWVLTRVADSDTNSELRAAYVLVTQGANGGVSYQQSTPSGSYDIVAGTGALVWSKFSQQVQYGAGNGISISGNTVALLVGGGTSWATGDIFYGASATSVGRIAPVITANAPLVSKGAGIKPDYLPYGLPATISPNQVYYAASSVLMSPVPGHAANRIMTTSSAGQPQWTDALPAVTINGANPVLDNQIIPLARGGTGLNHQAALNASMLYKSGGNWAATVSAAVVGSVPMCTVAGTTVDMVNLFARANTWSNVQVITDGTGNAPRGLLFETSFVPGAGVSVSSSALEWQGKSESLGTVYFHSYRARAFGKTFRLDQSAGNTSGAAPATWVNWLTWDTDAKALSILGGDAAAALTIGAVTLNGGPSTATISFPAPGGTVAVRQLPNTFEATQSIVTAAGNPFWMMARAGESQPRFQIDGEGPGGQGARIGWGPGGSSTLDTYLYRSGPQKLEMAGMLVLYKGAATSAGLFLTADAFVTGAGLWRAGLVEMAYGGLQANAAAFANGAMLYKTATGFAAVGGTNGHLKFPVSTGATVLWSGYTVPPSIASGDIVIGSATQTLGTLASPGGSGTHLLGLSGGLPAWQAIGAVPATGIGPGGSVGLGRVWATRYTGTSPANRHVTFTHGLGTRHVVAVGLRRTNSDDYASSSGVGTSEAWATRWDVLDTNSVRVWFPAPPTASETYVVTVLAA